MDGQNLGRFRYDIADDVDHYFSDTLSHTRYQTTHFGTFENITLCSAM